MVFITSATSSKIFRDPEIVNRIPQHVRDAVDQIVAEKVRRAVTTHFGYNEHDLLSFPEIEHHRQRRDGEIYFEFDVDKK